MAGSSRTHRSATRSGSWVSGIQLSANPHHSPPFARSIRLRRTLDTWGAERQAVLASLRIGVVGLGSVGSIIAEALARIGSTDILLVWTRTA